MENWIVEIIHHHIKGEDRETLTAYIEAIIKENKEIKDKLELFQADSNAREAEDYNIIKMLEEQV